MESGRGQAVGVTLHSSVGVTIGCAAPPTFSPVEESWDSGRYQSLGGTFHFFAGGGIVREWAVLCGARYPPLFHLPLFRLGQFWRVGVTTRCAVPPTLPLRSQFSESGRYLSLRATSHSSTGGGIVGEWALRFAARFLPLFHKGGGIVGQWALPSTARYLPLLL